MVGAILVEGATILPASAFAPVIERYAGRLLAPAELQALAGDIAEVARDAGFGLATAGIPQQRISGGILRVTHRRRAGSTKFGPKAARPRP